MKNLQPSDLNSLWSIASQARYLLCSVPCFHRAGPINSLLCQVLLFIALQKRSINSAVTVAIHLKLNIYKNFENERDGEGRNPERLRSKMYIERNVGVKV